MYLHIRVMMKKVLSSSRAAFDLGSIMVGVVVVGILMGVIAATVWIAIPWAQNNSSKETLLTVNKAQQAHYATEKSFGNFDELVDSGLMTAATNICSTPTDDGNKFNSAIISDTGKVFKNESGNLKPVEVPVGGVSCFGILTSGGEFTPAPRPTILTLNCPVTTTVTLPFRDATGTVTWSDGTVRTFTSAGAGTSSVPSKSLTANTDYTVSVEGTYTSMNAVSAAGQACIKTVEQWNLASGVTSMSGAFNRATNLVSIPEPPKTVTAMASMFANSNFNQDISGWDMSRVTTIEKMFENNVAFNQPIGAWNTGKVTNMNSVFAGATTFNQQIGTWNTSSVTGMASMFNGATRFNASLNSWSVSKVRNMNAMFMNAATYNQSMSGWNVGAVTDFSNMFNGAKKFNSAVSGTGWTVAAGINFSNMFANASVFNQSVGTWKMGTKAKNLSGMFQNAVKFNRAIYIWDVSTVTDFSNMFNGAAAYNQPLSRSDGVYSLSFASAVNLDGMFQNAKAFNQPLNDISVENTVTSMNSMFAGAILFDQPLEKWNPNAVTAMDSMFAGATVFNQNISTWNVTKVTSFANFRTGSALTTTNTPTKFR